MADNFYGITDTGKMRDNNEDNFIVQNISNGKYIAGCVIDGVGGYEGGEMASALARTAILNTLKKTSGDIIDVLKRSFVAANQKIFDKKQATGENMQMACVLTLALADINENKFYYAHVGDTRLYLFRDNSLVKVTHDHSFVGFLEDSGRITEETAMNHPKRNEINKALGFDEGKFSEPDYVETGESPFLPGDMLLLCSDGLSDMLSSAIISGILKSPHTVKEKCKALIDAANVAGGKDNITVVLIRNNKSPLQHEATKPLNVKKNDLPQETTVKHETNTSGNAAPKRRSGIGIRFFAVLCFLSLAALAWFVYNDYFKSKYQKEIISDVLPAARNRQVQMLSDSINKTTAAELSLKELFGQGQSVTINDSVLIQKDSLHINGHGISLIADSMYNGTAIIISQHCKYILLDSLTLENFNTAIFVHNNALHLKNVRFKNCGLPVLYALQLKNDQDISGSISDSAFLKVDSTKSINTK